MQPQLSHSDHSTESTENRLYLYPATLSRTQRASVICRAVRWGQDWCARARVRATSEHRDPKAERKTSPSRHTRGRLWSNSLVRAFLADLTALPTNLPVPPREATRKNALTAPVHLDKHTLERQGRPRRPSRDLIPSAPFVQRIYVRIYVPSRTFPPARFARFLPCGEKRRKRVGQRRGWKGGKANVNIDDASLRGREWERN